ncbi:MAG: hypothetical protein HYS18_10650 [Burkholderiales bacterium]|nr:hypothetical protein [Burkholderiales bacterium]
MSKSSSSPIPGMNAMADTFDFFRNMWSGMPGMNLPGMNLPSMVMPTLSVDEIERQIKELKAVESWLALNLNMLQGTIQALEVQKATISTIHTMGESFTAAMQPSPPKPAESAPKAEKAGKPAFESPFHTSAFSTGESAPAGKSTAEAPTDDQQAMIPPMANPAVWWNMLQDQFKQAVDTAAAMAPEAPAESANAAKSPASVAPRKRKSPSKEE